MASLEDFLNLYFQLSETDRSKVIQELMHYMNEPDFKTSIGAISNLQESERKKAF
ncbi:hypothetical protein ACT7CT_24005 [Bacillus sanguinis]